MLNEIISGSVESVCPECLRKVRARKSFEGNKVYLEKECPDHGSFRVLIWEGKPEYKDWTCSRTLSTPWTFMTETDRGCPFDCGLCPDHRVEACCVLLEVTSRCNLYCPVCFASTNPNTFADPGIDLIEGWYRRLLEYSDSYNIQLSGGEPTVRDDLPEIISVGHRLGFEYIQLNTNGLRLGEEPGYAEELAKAGLNSVFLQFDGTSDEIHRTMRGRPLMDIKAAAIDNCARNGIGVVLVPTLVRDVNISNIGDIIRFAVEHIPWVRGVHFQPLSFFGRYPGEPPADRITIPGIIREIEYQTNGTFEKNSFKPSGAENSYCSFNGSFMLMPDGKVKTLTSRQTSKCCSRTESTVPGYLRTRHFVARQWSKPGCCTCSRQETANCKDENSGIRTDSIDAFLERASTYTLSISGMAFQDAWTLELDRLKECKIHVFSPDGRLIPFCAYNLTAKNGTALYRRQEVQA